MRDISKNRLNQAVSKAGIAISRLDTVDTDQFFRERELVVRAAINSLGLTEGEPLFDLVRKELERRLRFCPD